MLDARRDSAGGGDMASPPKAGTSDPATSGTATSGATGTPEMAGVEDDEIPF